MILKYSFLWCCQKINTKFWKNAKKYREASLSVVCVRERERVCVCVCVRVCEERGNREEDDLVCPRIPS